MKAPILLIVILIAGYFLWFQNGRDEWKTYKNADLGVEFQYPSHWKQKTILSGDFSKPEALQVDFRANGILKLSFGADYNPFEYAKSQLGFENTQTIGGREFYIIEGYSIQSKLLYRSYLVKGADDKPFLFYFEFGEVGKDVSLATAESILETVKFN